MWPKPCSFFTSGFLQTLVAVVILAVTIQGVLSLYCLDCDHIANARDCLKVKKCGPHEVCLHQQYVNPNGYIYRKLKCQDRQFCKHAGKRSLKDNMLGKRQAGSAPFSVCDSCCDTDLCQASTCGDKGWPSPRGPICFNCNQQLKFECDQITMCGRDDVCFASLGTSADAQDRLLQTGCLNGVACTSLQSSAVGKRSVISHETCFDCSSRDLSNFHCNKTSSSGSGSVVTKPATGFTKTPCFDTQNPATCSLAAKVVCKNITLATNAGCLHSCHFC